MTTPAISPGAALAVAKRAASRERDWAWYLSLYGHGDRFVGLLRILPELDVLPADVVNAGDGRSVAAGCVGSAAVVEADER
jgi:hypothetical protein